MQISQLCYGECTLTWDGSRLKTFLLVPSTAKAKQSRKSTGSTRTLVAGAAQYPKIPNASEPPPSTHSLTHSQRERKVELSVLLSLALVRCPFSLHAACSYSQSTQQLPFISIIINHHSLLSAQPHIKAHTTNLRRAQRAEQQLLASSRLSLSIRPVEERPASRATGCCPLGT